MRQRRPPERLGMFCAMTSKVVTEDMPTTGEAWTSSDPENWMRAIHEEMSSLELMGTWDEDRIEVPRDAKILPSKFVLKVKRQTGLWYNLAPVVDFTVVRMIMAIAAKKGYKVHQMDVKTAFLNGDVDVDVYLRLPKEIQGMYGRDKFCHLRRSLYGLKQAPMI
jgi:hypothetical protein